jgi:kynurenine formamidase
MIDDESTGGTSMANIIDLTYPLSEQTVMFPEFPQPEIEPFYTIEKEGANVSLLNFVSHVGTHIDAPRHMLEGTRTVDELSLERLIGEAVVVDVSLRQNPALISLADLKQYENSILPGDILLVITGVYKVYGTPAYNTTYPALTTDAAHWLVKKGIAAYATDATSIEVPGSSGNPAHKILLGSEIPIIENLCNLDRLSQPRVRFICLPLKVKGGDGGPCRVVVIGD